MSNYLLPIRSLFMALISVSILLSCDSSTLINQKVDLPQYTWHADTLLNFDFTIEDTTQSYDMYYFIRNGLSFPYYNIYIKYTIKDQNDSIIASDLQEMQLMDAKSGKPYGSGFGDTYNHTFLSLKKAKFKSRGKYVVCLQHYMRDKIIEDIQAIGIKIKASEKEAL